MAHPDIEELSSPDEPSVSLPYTSSHEAVLRVSGTRSRHRTTIRVSGYVCKRCQPLRRPWWQICQSRRLGLVFSLMDSVHTVLCFPDRAGIHTFTSRLLRTASASTCALQQCISVCMLSKHLDAHTSHTEISVSGHGFVLSSRA